MALNDPDRWRRIEALYHAAAELPPEKRAALLTEECHDDLTLRAEVESLLVCNSNPSLTWTPEVSSAAPALAVGAHVGAYTVTGILGAGGMGEVYRARDTRLGRDVAIKTLPPAFMADQDRVARFTREARLLASINHPNVAAIYGFEEATVDGMDGQSTPVLVHALVLELVAGETLAERIARGPVPERETVALARQIADALSAAHDAGIVHRDVKPANIKITPAGVVKVLDFGLATARTDSHSDGTQLPTMSANRTHSGVLLGTAPYMSPEQARGQATDKRTDVWAFGCVVFEMLAGERAFGGETVTDTLVSILEREPRWERLPGSIAPGLRRLLRRCLRKDPAARLHDVADARIELDEVAAGIADEPIVTGAATPVLKKNRSLLYAAASVAATVATLAIVTFLFRSNSNTDAVPTALTRLTYDSGFTGMPALSPDGRLVAYTSDRAGRGDRDIWVQQVAGGVPLRLTDDPSDDVEPDFSPDGREIAFRSDRNGGGIYIVSALGGTARLVVPGARRPRYSPDGTQLAYTVGDFRGNLSLGQTSVSIVEVASGRSRRLLPTFVTARYPTWSPDGRSMLVIGRRDTAAPLDQSFDWWWVPVDGGTPVRTGVLDLPGLRVAEAAPYAWTDEAVFFSDGQNLRSVKLSPSSHRVTGPAGELTLGSGAYAAPAVSSNGAIVFAAMSRERVIARAPLDVAAPRTPVRVYADGQDGAYRASITADGTTVVMEQHVGREWLIWRKNLGTGEQQLLGRVMSSDAVNPTIAPDGSHVAYTVVAGSNEGNGYVLDTAGGTPRQVCEQCVLFGFLHDGRHVLAQAGQLALRVYGLDGSFEDLITVDSGVVNRPHVSPDDRWLAFRQGRAEGGKSYVVPLTPGQPPPMSRWHLVDEPTITGRPAGWSLDSRLLYLLLDTDGFRCLWAQRIDPATGVPVGAPYPAYHFHGNQVATAGGVSTTLGNAVSAAGFIYEAVDTRSDLWQLTRPPSARSLITQ